MSTDARLNRDQLVALAKSQITEVTPQALNAAIKNGQRPLVIDIREREEFEQGHVPGAIFIPRGFLELRIEQHAFDSDMPIVLYSAGRGAFCVGRPQLERDGLRRVEIADWQL